MKKPRRVVVKEELLDKLWKAYLDSLDLKEKKDLTEWGRGELFVLREVFNVK